MKRSLISELQEKDAEISEIGTEDRKICFGGSVESSTRFFNKFSNDFVQSIVYAIPSTY